MRNIIQYPVTGEEILQTLDNAQKTYTENMTFGGIDGFVLEQLIEFLKVEKNMKQVIDFTQENVKLY